MYTRLRFGKHKGKLLTEVPTGYLQWCLRECDSLESWLIDEIEQELARRSPPEAAPRSTSSQPSTGTAMVDFHGIVRTWYREMALRFHPDRDGSHVAMCAINTAHERLLELLDVA
jgi:hypothetical protein